MSFTTISPPAFPFTEEVECKKVEATQRQPLTEYQELELRRAERMQRCLEFFRELAVNEPGEIRLAVEQSLSMLVDGQSRLFATVELVNVESGEFY